jgi:glycolate oxidase
MARADVKVPIAPELDESRRALLAELASTFPPARFLTLADDLFVYECDAQTFDRGRPLCLVLPETTEEVCAVVKACSKPRRAVFAPRGWDGTLGRRGGERQCGHRDGPNGSHLRESTWPSRRAWVGPGVVNAQSSRERWPRTACTTRPIRRARTRAP